MKTTMPSEKNRVYIFDTTLRDGEQCPGASLGPREKMEIARQLARLGVDFIEAGFPISSPGDFESVRQIAAEIKGPGIAALARCVNRDIECAAEAVAPAGKRGRVHVFLATSAIHRQFKLKKAKDEIVRLAAAGVRHARKLVQDVQFSPEDASRTEPDFLAEVVRAVIAEGATTVNIPDTVGYAIPSDYGNLIAYLFEHVAGLDKVRVHVHCHNDLGLAVANSLAAVQNGARGVECTVNGLGERAGNCALEEVVMALRTRADAFGVRTGVETRELSRTSRLVSKLTGMAVQRNKAIVGANAFAHESGIHQDGMLKERTTYEIMRPQDVGITGTELVLGKHSGRHGLVARLKHLGYELGEQETEAVYRKFIVLADKKKNIYDDDILALMQGSEVAGPGVFALDYLHVLTGTQTVPTATVRLTRGNEVMMDSCCGDGPVDATLKAIERLTGVKGRLLEYNIQSVTKGEDAQGEVSIQVLIGDQVVSAKGSSTDIVEASARAYLNAINRHLLVAGRKPAPGRRGRRA